MVVVASNVVAGLQVGKGRGEGCVPVGKEPVVLPGHRPDGGGGVTGAQSRNQGCEVGKT